MEKNNDTKVKKNLVAEAEEKVLEFWEKSKTFEKSVNKEAPEGEYVFYDGPPFITGMPHYATLLPSIAKDLIPRYWTMKGYRVKRVWGWDCHGLPAENKVEQELGLKNKQDIEDLGVGKFVDACRNYVNTGSEQWKWYIDRIARWVDMDNAYKTMDLPFMESVIWAFKQLHDKGLIYEGYRSSLHCPRCATPLSKFEITMDAGSYKDVSDESVVVKFKLKNVGSEATGFFDSLSLAQNDKVFILAWTTTPWTLPGNLALAVGESIKYKVINIKGREESYVLASDMIKEVFKDEEYEVIKEIKGICLIGLSYEPLFELSSDVIKDSDKSFKIYHADFVSTEDGTGVVHIAPNFGEDDFELGKKEGLPMVDLMNEMGHYSEEAGNFAGMFFKKAGNEVMEKLGDRLFFKKPHTHSYPFCYRCNSRLIYKTQKAWYLKISEIRQKMLETNKKINWIPEFFKEGRFQYNLENAPDWCLSRSRYWGSPIPVWRCEECGKIEVLGSLDEIEKKSGQRPSDLHRPAIDEVEYACSCDGRMKRVKEVMDCWFESGSMPFAQFHFPFNQEDKVDFDKPQFPFPADFIIEYTGQLRGWFYYLHVLSNALFNDVAYKNVIVSGVLAGTDGRKMSKSYGNYPDPKETLHKYGADALRLYFMQSSIMSGDDTSLSEKDIQDALRKNVMLLGNVVKFYQLFAEDNANLQINVNASNSNNANSDNILDQWIMVRLEQLLFEVTKGLEEYDLPKASRPITPFIDDLSTWYIRRSRDRFKSGDEKDKKMALIITRYVLVTLAKIIAPIMPFVAERVWQEVTGYNFASEDKSVHLEAWPGAHNTQHIIHNDVIDKMTLARKVVEFGLAKRDEAGIKVRQPLAQLKVKSRKYKVDGQYIALIKDEVNVKEVVCEDGGDEIEVILDTKIDEDLKAEGMKREIVRSVNAMRKNAGLTIQDRVNVFWSGGEVIARIFEKFGEEIGGETLAETIARKDIENGKEVDVNGERVIFELERV